jgi:hypothetical protein
MCEPVRRSGSDLRGKSRELPRTAALVAEANRDFAERQSRSSLDFFFLFLRRLFLLLLLLFLLVLGLFVYRR